MLEMADRHEMVDRHEMEMFMLRSKDEGSKLGVEPGNDDRAGTFPKTGALAPQFTLEPKKKICEWMKETMRQRREYNNIWTAKIK